MRVGENMKEHESWKNATQSTVVLKRYDRTGNIIDEIVRGGKTFFITPDERKLNQEIAVKEEFDMFMNGLLAPVRLLETADDVDQFASNPNHMSEADMMNLLKGKASKAFKDRVSQITNPVTLNRLLQIAQSEEADASLAQVNHITACLQEKSPSLYTEVQTVAGPTPRPQSPGASGGPRTL